MTTKTKIDTTLMTAEAQKMGEVVMADPTAVVAVAQEAAKAKFKPMTRVADTEVKAALAEVDLSNTNSITTFGSAASRQASAVSREMMAGVRNKDTGPVGDTMSEMVGTLRGLDPKDLNGGGLFGWMKSQASRALQFAQKYESVAGQIDSMAETLDTHKTVLMTSVEMNDRLYNASEYQFHSIEVYIIAGQELLTDLNTNIIPAMQAKMETNPDDALLPQEFKDLLSKRDQMERKVHDLKLVRMVTLQALPKIRLTQDSDIALIGKIETIISTTIPIWEQNMALALSVAKTASAAEATNLVTDATAQMLMQGAEEFQTANLEARKAVERGVVSVEVVQNVNQVIIDTIGEAVEITKQGKQMRADAEAALVGTEAALREALKQTAGAQQDYADIADSSDGE